MVVKVLDILDHVLLVEYADEILHRKYISRDVLPIVMKNIQFEVDDKILLSSMEYGDVDLVEHFGEDYLGYPIAELQEAMKRNGLWTRAEYLKHPEKITYVLRQYPGIDVQTIQNATRRN